MYHLNLYGECSEDNIKKIVKYMAYVWNTHNRNKVQKEIGKYKSFKVLWPFIVH